MREEEITKSIVTFLKKNGWKILSFDYPQSGSGIYLSPNCKSKKTKEVLGAIVPDVVAKKENQILIFENKPRISNSDVEKLGLIKSGEYSESITEKFGSVPSCIQVAVGIAPPRASFEPTACRGCRGHRRFHPHLVCRS